METDRFARARVLMEQKRYDLALKEITARIGDDPEDPEGYILTALCRHLTNQPGAWDAAQRAVELAPNECRAHFVVSITEAKRGNLDEAEAAIRRAIELNTWNAGYFGQLSAIDIARYRWNEALQSANEGLAIDPDDEVCLNHRAVALTKLGRHAEAASTLEGTLEKHPEDAHTHANRGWTLLHENEPRKAIEHFRESLRLNPNSEWAKQGMLEALRAKNWFYRRVLQFFLMLSRFPPKVQFGLIIGMILVVRVLNKLGEQIPAIAPVCNVLILAYVAFVAATWFSKHLINMMLLFDRDGRNLLDRTQRWISGICTVLVVLVLVLVTCAIFGTDRRTLLAAMFAFLFAVHFASVFEIPAGRYRWMGIALSAVILGLFAWERIERFELSDEFDRIIALANAHDAKLEDLKARESSMSREEIEETQRWLRQTRAEVEPALVRIRARLEQLNSWDSLLGFASLGGLLLHGVLALKAQRASWA